MRGPGVGGKLRFEKEWNTIENHIDKGSQNYLIYYKDTP